MKRRPYLLLELLIAFSIVTLRAIPLVRTPVNVLETEILSLEKMELQRSAELAFGLIEEKLYKNEIPWKTIIVQSKQDEPYLQDKINISLGKDHNQVFDRRFFFGVKNTNWEKTKKNMHFSP